MYPPGQLPQHGSRHPAILEFLKLFIPQSGPGIGPVMESRDVSGLKKNLETCFSRLSLGSVSTRVLAPSSFHVLSCLMTVSLSGIVKCLFCAEKLAFLAEGRPRGPFIHCLLTYCKVAALVVVVVLWL